MRDEYRVVIQPKTDSRAQALTEELKSLGYKDVFIYYYTAPKGQ